MMELLKFAWKHEVNDKGEWLNEDSRLQWRHLFVEGPVSFASVSDEIMESLSMNLSDLESQISNLEDECSQESITLVEILNQ